MKPSRFLLSVAAAAAVFGQFAVVFGSDWPQWRGLRRDGWAGPDEPRISALPAELKPEWKMPVGGGFSAPVVASGKLVYLDEKEGQEYAHAVDLKTHRPLWQTAYSESFGDEWGTGPRATPIVDDGRVYVQSCRGEFHCLDLESGKSLWHTSYEKDFGVQFVGAKVQEGVARRRGNNGSGVIDGDRLILPVGSVQGATLACFDKKTGKVLWKTGNEEMAYASLVVANLAGVRQVVAFTADSLMGASVEEGKILWRVPLVTNAKRHASTPLIVDDLVIVNSHTIGLVAFRISKSGAGLEARPAWSNAEAKINIASPVYCDGNLYTQGANKDFICVDAKTGKLRWSQPDYGRNVRDYASAIVIGKNILVLAESGRLSLIAADPSQYRELGQLQVCGSTWCFPALSGGKLYVRDQRELLCISL